MCHFANYLAYSAYAILPLAWERFFVSQKSLKLLDEQPLPQLIVTAG
jgi:hypothetical protein